MNTSLNFFDQHTALFQCLVRFFQVFRGLAYIHTVPGVCHRDLKPQNILVLFFDDLKVDMEIEIIFC